MGDIGPVEPVKFFCGILAAGEQWLDRAAGELAALLGPIDRRSEPMPFVFTDYYRAETGPAIVRQFVSFAVLRDPGELAGVKVRTNAIEQRLAAEGAGRVRRPVNLDPGYVTAAKLVLATTKDFAHRIYLGGGIYAEVTLGFGRTGCRPFPWTYPDFRSEAYHPFFLDLRRVHREQLAALSPGG